MTTKTKTQTVPFDAAEYLDDEDTIAAFLTEALSAGDAEHFQDALQTVARAKGMSQIAEAAGLGRESLYKALRPGAAVRFDTVQRVLTALGMQISFTPATAH